MKWSTPSRGVKFVADDDVGYYLDALMRVNTGRTELAAKDPFRGGAQGGWHQQQEQFMRGYTHGAFVKDKLKTAKIYKVPNRIPQITLATAVYNYVNALTSGSSPGETEAQGWVEWEKVKALVDLQTTIDNGIGRDTTALKIAMRKPHFIEYVNTLDPFDYMDCAAALIEALQRGGELHDYMKLTAENRAANAAERDVLDDRRLNEIFDMLEADDPAKGTVKVMTGATHLGAGAKAADLKAWNDYLKKTPAFFVFKRITDFRSKAIPALMMWKHRGFTTLTSTEFSTFSKDMLSRGTGMFYPKGTFTAAMTLEEMQAAAKEFDGDQFQRWKTLDAGITRVADSFTVNSGTLLGMFGFAAAVTTLYSARDLQAQDVMGVLSSGVSLTDDIALRYAAFGAAKPSEFLRASSGAAKALSGVVLKRVIFVFGIVDAARAAHNVTTSTSTGEIIGNALTLLGALAGVGSTGVGMMVGAGLISVPAAPLVIVGLVGAAVSVAGAFIASAYKVTDQEKILGASALGKGTDLRLGAASLPVASTEVHKGFAEMRTDPTGANELIDDYDVQLARVRGLAGGMRLQITFGPEYTWRTTPFRSDLSELSADLSELTIDLRSIAPAGFDTDLIKSNLMSDGNVRVPGGPDVIDQTTTVDAQASYAEPFERAVLRRLSAASGASVTLPPEPPRMAFLERASA